MAQANADDPKIKHRAVIEFLSLEGTEPREIYDRMIRVYGEGSISYSTVFRWNREFSRGRTTLKDDPRTGRPSTGCNEQNIELVRRILNDDRRLTVRLLVMATGLSDGTIRNILHNELHMTKVCARWVPKMLSLQDRQRRVQTSRELLARYYADPELFENSIITEDETWLHHYDPETKSQSAQWKTSEEPAPRKFKTQRSAGKVLASVFWDAKGVLLVDILQAGHTINGPYYADLLRQLRRILPEKRKGLVRRGVLLLHDNAPAHTSDIASTAAEECGFALMPHPPYSPDLAPSDYYLFPNLKRHLKGERYDDDDEVVQAANEWFAQQPKEFYLTGIRKLQDRLEKCIANEGDYVEK